MDIRSLDQNIRQAMDEGCTLSQLALRHTAHDLSLTEEQAFAQMEQSLQIMKQSVAQGRSADLRSPSGLTGPIAHKMSVFSASEQSISGPLMGEILSNALAVAGCNACMGRIVAAPTAGSCGILPGCLIALQNHRGFNDHALVMALYNASAVGLVINHKATVAGAEGGCQAECGSAAAMAASAMVELLGGSPECCGHAVAHALKCTMGLVCDPVAGLVEDPCVIRNGSCAWVAVAAAEMALAGVKSLIPADQVIEAMGQVGRLMPESLRETSKAGLAATPAAKALAKQLFGN